MEPISDDNEFYTSGSALTTAVALFIEFAQMSRGLSQLNLAVMM